MTKEIIDTIGLIVAIILPLWNIPLVVNIIKRKSSRDISLWWALGVWVCMLLMAPSGFTSQDVVWKTFSLVNLILFTVVVIVTVRFRHGPTNS